MQTLFQLFGISVAISAGVCVGLDIGFTITRALGRSAVRLYRALDRKP